MTQTIPGAYPGNAIEESEPASWMVGGMDGWRTDISLVYEGKKLHRDCLILIGHG